MKGLLLKDWYMLWKEVKYYVPFTVVYALVAAFTGVPMMFVMINVMLGSMIVKSLMAREEQNKWNSMAVNLPVTVKEMVTEKYLIGLVGTLASNVVSFLVLLVIKLAFQRNTQMPLFPFFMIYMGFGAIYLAGELPVLFKFGTTKGRVVFMTVVALLAGVSAAVSSTLSESVSLKNGMQEGELLVVAAVLIIVAALAVAGSVRLSVAFYEKREF